MDSVPPLVPYRKAYKLREKLISLSQSYLRATMIWVSIAFTSVFDLFLLSVLKQPDWPHFKKEKGDTYPKASLRKEVGQGDHLPASTLPFCLK